MECIQSILVMLLYCEGLTVFGIAESAGIPGGAKTLPFTTLGFSV
jgi:hypothetical protein